MRCLLVLYICWLLTCTRLGLDLDLLSLRLDLVFYVMTWTIVILRLGLNLDLRVYDVTTALHNDSAVNYKMRYRFIILSLKNLKYYVHSLSPSQKFLRRGGGRPNTRHIRTQQLCYLTCMHKILILLTSEIKRALLTTKQTKGLYVRLNKPVAL